MASIGSIIGLTLSSIFFALSLYSNVTLFQLLRKECTASPSCSSPIKGTRLPLRAIAVLNIVVMVLMLALVVFVAVVGKAAGDMMQQNAPVEMMPANNAPAKNAAGNNNASSNNAAQE